MVTAGMADHRSSALDASDSNVVDLPSACKLPETLQVRRGQRQGLENRDRTMTADTFSDIVCELGEGPSADPGRRCVFWFDIIGKRLLERPWDRPGTLVHDLPVMASAQAVIDDQRQLLFTEVGLQVRNLATGALAMHTPIEADDPRTRSNDARVHPCGAFWLGTMGKRAEKRAGAVYWFFRGELRRIFEGISIINSICFSPDGRTAFFADTRARTVWRVDTDPLTGLPIGERQQFMQITGGPGSPDGSVTDAEGLLWNASWGAGSVDAYDGDGRRVHSIAVPAKQSSCPAFIGEDATRMLVTTATQGLDPAGMQKDPLAGQTFVLAETFRGRFDPPVRMA
jgi:sugar lactone lactonase